MSKGANAKGPDFLGLLLSRLGLGGGGAQETKRRKRKRRPGGAGPDGAADAPFPAPSEAGAFSSAVSAAALGQEASYEAASAAGYAPPSLRVDEGLEALGPVGPAPTPATPEAEDPSGLRLPNFGVEPPPGDRPALKKPEVAPRPADGKIFDMGALDENLDQLFAGLGGGASGAPKKVGFDEFGLTRPVPVPAGKAPEAPAPGLTDPTAPLPVGGPIGLDDPFGGPDPFKPEAPPPPPPAPSLEAPPAPPTLGPVASATPPKPLMPAGMADPDAPYRAPSPAAEAPAEAPVAPVAEAPAPAPAAPRKAHHLGPAPMMGGGPAPARLPLAAAGQLKRALDALEHVPGVAGALVVGEDGLAIASSLPPALDAEALGAQLGSLFHDLGLRLGAQGRGGLRRVVLETELGVLVVCAADVGILVVVSHEGQAIDGSAVWAALTGALGLG